MPIHAEELATRANAFVEKWYGANWAPCEPTAPGPAPALDAHSDWTTVCAWLDWNHTTYEPDAIEADLWAALERVLAQLEGTD